MNIDFGLNGQPTITGRVRQPRNGHEPQQFQQMVQRAMRQHQRDKRQHRRDLRAMQRHSGGNRGHRGGGGGGGGGQGISTDELNRLLQENGFFGTHFFGQVDVQGDGGDEEAWEDDFPRRARGGRYRRPRRYGGGERWWW